MSKKIFLKENDNNTKRVGLNGKPSLIKRQYDERKIWRRRKGLELPLGRIEEIGVESKPPEER